MSEQINELSFSDRDEYIRKPIAERVIQLLNSRTRVSPMIIDGGWGTGKTEFCHKLIDLIENGESGIKPVYVDAFKADHADEPLMTLLAAVLKALPENDRPSLIQKALPAVRFGIKTTLKAGISWLLKQDAASLADDLEEDLKKAGDEAINHAVESLIKDHMAAEKSIAALRLALQAEAEKVPYVLFVDELDRCRPDFAVSMLETIKHIFDVEGLQIVLVTNSRQLLAAINHCYGDKVEAQRYLDKFVGFKFSLPQTFKSEGSSEKLASLQHLDTLLISSDLLEQSCVVSESNKELLRLLVEQNRLSLREVETLVRYLEIYHILTNGQGLHLNLAQGNSFLRIVSVYLFCFQPERAESVINGGDEVAAIAAMMGKHRLADLSTSSNPDYADIVVAFIGYQSGLTNYDFGLTSPEIRTQWDKHIAYGFGYHIPRYHNDIISILQKTIKDLKLGG